MIMATIQSKLKPSGEARPGSSSSASGCVQPPSFPRRQDLASRPCPSVGTHAVPSCQAEGAQDGARKAVAWSSRESGTAAGMKIPPLLRGFAASSLPSITSPPPSWQGSVRGQAAGCFVWVLGMGILSKEVWGCGFAAPNSVQMGWGRSRSQLAELWEKQPGYVGERNLISCPSEIIMPCPHT